MWLWPKRWAFNRRKKICQQWLINADLTRQDWLYYRQQIKYAQNQLALEETIVKMLSKEQQTIFNHQLASQQADQEKNCEQLYHDFILDCLFRFNQADFYKSTISRNQIFFLDLKNYPHFDTEEKRLKNLPKVFGTNWKHKIMIENSLNIEFKTSTKENNRDCFLEITSTNGFNLAQAKQFFDHYIGEKYYFQPSSKISELIVRVKADFYKQCLQLGENIMSNFLSYPPNSYSLELAALIGTTKYKFTEKQNLLEHLLEVATISGAIASKLHLDVVLAKRCGFFHDIGKISTNNYSGHNQIHDGLKLAEKFHLGKEIREVIAKHHDPKDKNNLYLLIVKAADVLSAARPGARWHKPAFFKKSREMIRQKILTLNWVKKVEILNWNQQIVVFAKTEIQSNYAIYKSQLIKLLHHLQINNFQKIFKITIHLLDANNHLLSEKYDQFYYDNLHNSFLKGD